MVGQGTMTPSQKMEVRRLTWPMWCMLSYAQKMEPMGAAIGGSFMRTARILVRRGFLSIAREAKGGRARLTEAGLEALAMRKAKQRPT